MQRCDGRSMLGELKEDKKSQSCEWSREKQGRRGEGEAGKRLEPHHEPGGHGLPMDRATGSRC